MLTNGSLSCKNELICVQFARRFKTWTKQTSELLYKFEKLVLLKNFTSPSGMQTFQQLLEKADDEAARAATVKLDLELQEGFEEHWHPRER